MSASDFPQDGALTTERRRASVLRAVSAIPSGSVLSYAQVAVNAGIPGRARWVARILSESAEAGLPWHRVLRASGHIAFPPGSPMFDEQTQRLRAEGVRVDDGRVKMARRGTDLDSLLWAPD